MKKSFLIVVSVICAAIICSSLIISASADKNAVVSEETVATVSEKEQNFLNMLNNNFVYGSDFDNADDMVNLSLNALVSYKDKNDDYINAGVVTSFVSDMYGVDIVDLSKLNAEYPQKDGYVYMVARANKKYEHSNIKLTYNEDGTITAATDVAVLDESGNKTVLTASSLFVPNEKSSLGYNIVYSELTASGISL